MKVLDLISLALIGVVVAAVAYVFVVGGEFIGADKNQPRVADIGADKQSLLPDLGPAPEISGISGWVNTEPVSLAELRGKVVLVDFWTYSCINCIRTFPYLSDWHETYKDMGFTVLGVHTPEFEFEKDRTNVVQATAEHNLTYPVALDNDYKTWNAFKNRFWPAHYLIDAEGRIRYTHFGEGRYTETEAAIQQLLFEAGLASEEDVLVPEQVVQQEQDVMTPEIYFGLARNEFTEQDLSGLAPNTPRLFNLPAELTANTLYFDGLWEFTDERALSRSRAGKIVLPYSATDLHMVLFANEEVIVEVLRDGAPLTKEIAGEDIYFENGRSYARIGKARKYTFISDEISGSHTFELITPPGLEAYTFTFG